MSDEEWYRKQEQTLLPPIEDTWEHGAFTVLDNCKTCAGTGKLQMPYLPVINCPWCKGTGTR